MSRRQHLILRAVAVGVIVTLQLLPRSARVHAAAGASAVAAATAQAQGEALAAK